MNSLTKKIIFSFFSSLVFFSFSQTPVNGYAHVSAINDSTLTLSNVDEQYDTFEDGEQVIIMQMQGAVISDSSNSFNFGNIATVGSAGLYEVATIFSHTESGGLPNVIKLSSKIKNTYSITGTVQIISFPLLGGGASFTTTTDIGAKIFDGTKGGVLCFQVAGNIYQQNNIVADGSGFKGGAKSTGNSTGNCDPSLYAGPFGYDKSLKGQGVYKVGSSVNSGRAHCANGGGGGALHNGGGAGGGNYSTGGNGGQGWDKCPNDWINGFGGASMAPYTSAKRIFLGGGGGGGNENTSQGSTGVTGGGIIILKCDSIISNGSCSSVRISANGNSNGSTGQDGQGGGGAGGSIVLDVLHVKSNATCPLVVSANGGNGGNVGSTFLPQGGGGGGGQGTIMILCGGTAQNVSLQTHNGKGGKNMSSFSPTYAQDGGGNDDAGIFIGVANDTIPAIFSYFNAVQDSMAMLITWQTTYEKDIANFELQKTYLTNPWQFLSNFPGHGAGVYNGITNYSYMDHTPYDDLNTYRLKITDTLGCNYYTPSWSGTWVREEYETSVVVWEPGEPDVHYVRGNFKFDDSWFKVYDARGRLVSASFTKVTDYVFKFVTEHLAEGVYFVTYRCNGEKGAKKFEVYK